MQYDAEKRGLKCDDRCQDCSIQLSFRFPSLPCGIVAVGLVTVSLVNGVQYSVRTLHVSCNYLKNAAYTVIPDIACQAGSADYREH